MPADHSKTVPATRNRRQVRKDNEDDRLDPSHTREIELKRSRGEISCAECRRLKIRCDKTIPCQSCQRRGCAALCPNGSLATGQGTRFVLAATEHLHKRIAKMGERIRQLEDALAILQAKHSDDPHPLLHDDAMATTKAEPLQEDDVHVSEQAATKAADVIEAFGTLSVYNHGVSRFFGPSGGTEYLLYTDSDSPTPSASASVGSKSPESHRDSMSPPGSSELSKFSAAFPFTPVGPTNSVLELIESHLPSWDRACHLCESFLNNAAWLFRSVSKQQLLLEMLPSIYHRAIPETAAQVDYSGPHDYALLYLVFALGAVMDLKQEPYNAEGEHYHQIARAALVLQPILEKPSVVTIQALHLLSVYNGTAGNELGGGETSLETTWALTGFACQLSQSIGLHRDSARWGLPEVIVNRRRLLFWNLFVADSWTCLATGRPPSFSRQYIDCEFPASDEGPPNPALTKEGQPDNDFGTWGFRFALQCVAEVAARTLTAEAPSYQTIMELDRKVREFPIPADASAFLEDIKAPEDPDDEIPLSVSMTRFVLSHSREVILLSIHRAFFAQAILDCPENPLRSQYAPSFLASYRAAATILKAIDGQFNILPTVCARFWVIWTYAFSSAVVFGAIVTRGPRSALAQQAISKLDTAYELFCKAAKLSRRAARALPLVLKMKEKAHYAMTNASSLDGAQWSIDPEDQNADELEIFAGKTRLVETKQRNSVSPPMHPSAEFPNIRLDTDGIYESSGFTPSVISPPSAPPIPPLPAIATISDGGWYSQAQPSQYELQYPQQTDPSGRQSDFPVTPTYGQISSSSSPYEGQGWSQSHAPSPIHPHPQMQPPQLGQLPPGVSRPQPAPHTQTPSASQYRLPPLHMQFSEPSAAVPQFRQSIPHIQPQPVPSQHPSHPHTRHPQHPQHQAYMSDRPRQAAPQQQQMYPAAPAFQGITEAYVPPPEIVNLGLASRDSRLDERWASFMHDSGYLDTSHFRSQQ